MGGLKPNIRKIVATLVILLLPIFSERVPLAGGSFVVERYSPATMIYGYTVLWDIVPLLQMLGFSLFIYLLVAGVSVLLDYVMSKIRSSDIERISLLYE